MRLYTWTSLQFSPFVRIKSDNSKLIIYGNLFTIKHHKKWFVLPASREMKFILFELDVII